MSGQMSKGGHKRRSRRSPFRFKGTPPNPRNALHAQIKMKGGLPIDNQKTRIRIEIRLTEKQKEQVEHAAKRCGVTTSEYLRQRALGGEPEAVLPDAFFVCCEKLDRLTRSPYTKDVNDTAIAVLTEMQDILTGKRIIPAEKEEPEQKPPKVKPKRKLFGRR